MISFISYQKCPERKWHRLILSHTSSTYYFFSNKRLRVPKVLECVEAILIEDCWGKSSELLVISNLVVGVHFEPTSRDYLALILYSIDSIGQPILFSIVLGLYLNNIFLIRVIHNWRLFFLFPFRLAVEEYGLRVASEGQCVELIDFLLIELV